MISEKIITVVEDGWTCDLWAPAIEGDRYTMVVATAPGGGTFTAFWPHYDRELDEGFCRQLLHETQRLYEIPKGGIG